MDNHSSAAQANTLFSTLSKPLILWIVVFGWCLTIFISMLPLANPAQFLHKGFYTDYNVFALAGNLALEGRATEAYDPRQFVLVQKHSLHAKSLSPWTYPPAFELIVMILALLPNWLGYLIWSFGGLFSFLTTLGALSPTGSRVALVATIPATFICLADGQTGLILGALAGLVAINWKNAPQRAGIYLGLMAIKPQMALGLGALALFRREWKVLIYAFGTFVATSGLATVLFGQKIWSAFLLGITDAMDFLKAGPGFYPLHRMISAYAALRSVGVSSHIALSLQGLLAVVSVFLLLRTCIGSEPLRTQISLSILAGLCVTPYVFDYDLPIIAVAFCLLTPSLYRIKAPELGAIILFTWMAGCIGMIESLFISPGTQGFQFPVSFGFAAILAAILVVFLRRC